MFYAGIDEHSAGKLRDVNVFITGSEYVPSSPEKLPQEMARFEKWLNDGQGNAVALNAVVFAAELHRKLVSVHPF